MIELRICRVLALCVFLPLTLSSCLLLAVMLSLSLIVIPDSDQLQLLLYLELIWPFMFHPHVLQILDLDTHFTLLSSLSSLFFYSHNSSYFSHTEI